MTSRSLSVPMDMINRAPGAYPIPSDVTGTVYYVAPSPYYTISPVTTAYGQPLTTPAPTYVQTPSVFSLPSRREIELEKQLKAAQAISHAFQMMMYQVRSENVKLKALLEGKETQRLLNENARLKSELESANKKISKLKDTIDSLDYQFHVRERQLSCEQLKIKSRHQTVSRKPSIRSYSEQQITTAVYVKKKETDS